MKLTVSTMVMIRRIKQTQNGKEIDHLVQWIATQYIWIDSGKWKALSHNTKL